MPTFRTNLLVRDGRPAMFEADGCTVDMTTLSSQEFEAELRKKLVEEATEASTAAPKDIGKELADVFEILLNLGQLNGLSVQNIEDLARERRQKLGGFEKRVFTKSLSAPEGSETAAYHRQYPEKYPEIKNN